MLCLQNPRALLSMLTITASVALCAASADAKVTSSTTNGSGKAKIAAQSSQQDWCAPEIEALPGEACYLDGSAARGVSPNAKRTLVIFLHGAIAKNTTWSWNHERMLLRVAKATNVEMIFPRSPTSEAGFVWPGSLESQEKVEQDLIDGWMKAKTALETRGGRKFDEVFVMGFSSGAYFASSLAMRGRLDVDGYAVFAGGQPMPARPTPIQKFSPVFVGVCAADETTAAHSRAFAGSLSMAGIPRAALERPVGHGLDHVHFNSALAYLRNNKNHR